MIRPPTIREIVLGLKKGQTILIENTRVNSVSPIACRAGQEFEPRRRFITRQESAGVRVWRLV